MPALGCVTKAGIGREVAEIAVSASRALKHRAPGTFTHGQLEFLDLDCNRRSGYAAADAFIRGTSVNDE